MVQHGRIAGRVFDTNQKHIGVVAQELLDIAPEMISTDQESGYYKVDFSASTYMLINAIKEQQKIIDLLTKRVEELEKK